MPALPNLAIIISLIFSSSSSHLAKPFPCCGTQRDCQFLFTPRRYEIGFIFLPILDCLSSTKNFSDKSPPILPFFFFSFLLLFFFVSSLVVVAAFFRGGFLFFFFFFFWGEARKKKEKKKKKKKKGGKAGI